MHVLPNRPTPILCCYLNATPSMQVVRISDSLNGYLERTVFPGQHILFAALPTDRLEIYTASRVTAILTDTMTCDQLQVEETRLVA